jgi:hypothetical protein
VHLPIDPEQLSVGVDHGGGIVIDAGSTPLEDRDDDHQLQLGRQPPHALHRRARDRFGQIEPLGIGDLAEIRRVEELLQTDDLRASRGCLAHRTFRGADGGLLVFSNGLLNESDREWFGGAHWSSCGGELTERRKVGPPPGADKAAVGMNRSEARGSAREQHGDVHDVRPGRTRAQ